MYLCDSYVLLRAYASLLLLLLLSLLLPPGIPPRRVEWGCACGPPCAQSLRFPRISSTCLSSRKPPRDANVNITNEMRRFLRQQGSRPTPFSLVPLLLD